MWEWLNVINLLANNSLFLEKYRESIEWYEKATEYRFVLARHDMVIIYENIQVALKRMAAEKAMRQNTLLFISVSLFSFILLGVYQRARLNKAETKNCGTAGRNCFSAN